MNQEKGKDNSSQAQGMLQVVLAKMDQLEEKVRKEIGNLNGRMCQIENQMTSIYNKFKSLKEKQGSSKVRGKGEKKEEEVLKLLEDQEMFQRLEEVETLKNLSLN